MGSLYTLQLRPWHSVLLWTGSCIISYVDTCAWGSPCLVFGFIICIVFTTCDHVVVPYFVREFSSVNTVISKLSDWKVIDYKCNWWQHLNLYKDQWKDPYWTVAFVFFNMLKMILKTFLYTRCILWLQILFSI